MEQEHKSPDIYLDIMDTISNVFPGHEDRFTRLSFNIFQRTRGRGETYYIDNKMSSILHSFLRSSFREGERQMIRSLEYLFQNGIHYIYIVESDFNRIKFFIIRDGIQVLSIPSDAFSWFFQNSRVLRDEILTTLPISLKSQQDDIKTKQAEVTNQFILFETQLPIVLHSLIATYLYGLTILKS